MAASSHACLQGFEISVDPETGKTGEWYFAAEHLVDPAGKGKTIAVAGNLSSKTEQARAEWPAADLLVLVGSLTTGSNDLELERVCRLLREWTDKEHYRYVLVTGGAHDALFFRGKSMVECQALVDSRAQPRVVFVGGRQLPILGLKMYFECLASEVLDHDKLASCDFFFTDTVPMTVRDVRKAASSGEMLHTGSQRLLDMVEGWLVNGAGPAVVFGTGPEESWGGTHIQEGGGGDAAATLDVFNVSVSGMATLRRPILIPVRKMTTSGET